MTEAASTMGDAFALAADAVNGQVAMFAGSQVAVAESVGSSLAYVGNLFGEGASIIVRNPSAIGTSFAANVQHVASLTRAVALH